MANTSKALTHTFTLTTGDPSRDGHNMSDSTLFRCNKSLAEVKKSYGLSSKMYSLDLTRQCEDYEDGKFDTEFLEKLRAAFHNRPDLLGDNWLDPNHPDYDEDELYVDCDLFCQLYLEIAKLLDPELEWEEDNSSSSDLFIGGYGLYFN